MKQRNFHLASLLAVAALLILPCTDMFAKRPVLKNTRWVCITYQFVADVGNATETHTLEFTSTKECTLTDRWVLPSHPAMYRNPDGTVDTIPGSSSEHVSRATYKFRRNLLTLEFEDGTSRIYFYKDGKLTGAGRFGGEEMVFEKEAVQ